jgi:hypothetical protein
MKKTLNVLFIVNYIEFYSVKNIKIILVPESFYQ